MQYFPPNIETIKKILIVPDEFTGGGEITPTLKLKSPITEAQNKQQIDELYREPHSVETALAG